MVDTPAARVASWTAAGSPKQCIEHLRAYKQMGFHSVGLRVTSWNQMAQLRRVIDEVLPHV
jgi:alkanesulfonate monooxygenase SsuD/methylene tetrahydromethanopterin reductase-like flavin-dependent oxidoreductase (luciferase family)